MNLSRRKKTNRQLPENTGKRSSSSPAAARVGAFLRRSSARPPLLQVRRPLRPAARERAPGHLRSAARGRSALPSPTRCGPRAYVTAAARGPAAPHTAATCAAPPPPTQRQEAGAGPEPLYWRGRRAAGAAPRPSRAAARGPRARASPAATCGAAAPGAAPGGSAGGAAPGLRVVKAGREREPEALPTRRGRAPLKWHRAGVGRRGGSRRNPGPNYRACNRLQHQLRKL